MKIERSLQSKNLSKIQKIFANRKNIMSSDTCASSQHCHDTAHRVALGCTRSTWSRCANGLNCAKYIEMFYHKCGKEFAMSYSAVDVEL